VHVLSAGKWFALKKLVALLWLRRRRAKNDSLKKNGHGYTIVRVHSPELDNMESPQELSDDPNVRPLVRNIILVAVL